MIFNLDDHRKDLTARLRAVTSAQIESDKRERVARMRELDASRYRNQIRYAATRLAQIEGENATDEWLTQCMSRGVK
jgi:hypothetical protein